MLDATTLAERNAREAQAAAEAADRIAARQAAQDAYRTTAIEAVADIDKALRSLDARVTTGARNRDVLAATRAIRHHLRTIDDVTLRDGRLP